MKKKLSPFICGLIIALNVALLAVNLNSADIVPQEAPARAQTTSYKVSSTEMLAFVQLLTSTNSTGYKLVIPDGLTFEQAALRFLGISARRQQLPRTRNEEGELQPVAYKFVVSVILSPPVE